MRKISNLLLLAGMLAVQTFTGSAHAALTAAGPVNSSAPGAPFPANGMPAYYQDANGLALQGCLDNSPLGSITPLCVLPIIREEDYDFHSPIVYNGGLPGINPNTQLGPPQGPTAGLNGGTVNYPSETFYYYASSNPKTAPTIGSGSLFVLMAVEGSFVTKDSRLLQNGLPPADPKTAGNPRPVDGLQAVFQRIRIDLKTPPVAGNYTLTHPWGTIVFNCPTAGATICKSITDIPVGAPGSFLLNPDPALGQSVPGSIGPFMVSADPVKVPATPLPLVTNAAGSVFIGDPNLGVKGVVPNCAPNVCNTDANGFAILRLDGPPGSGLTTGNITEFFISGQIVGLQVTPNTSIDLGAVTIPGTSATKTITVKNLTTNPVLFPTLTTAGANAAEFAISADTCSGATLSVGASCTFNVAFAPAATAVAVRHATIALAPTTVQPNPAVNPPLADPPAVTVNLSGTGQYLLSLTVPTAVGGKVDSAPAGIGNCAAGPCTAAFNAGSSVTLTPTGAATAPLSLFGTWGGACTGSGACSVTMDAAKSVTASFVPAFTITTNATPSAGGTITPNQVVPQGSNQALIINANSCYHISSFADNGAPAIPVPVAGTSSSTYNVSNVTTDHAVSVSFSNQQSISKSAGANGSVTGPAIATCGAANTSYSIVPNPKFKVRDILLNNQAQSFTPAANPGGAVTFTIPTITSDQTIAATFMPSGDVDGNGTIDVADALKALRLYIGLDVPKNDDFAAMKVTPLDGAGKPNGTGIPDLNDVVMILKRAVGMVTW